MVEIALNDRQLQVIQSEATEILYGGAAYGGKSYLLRALATALCYDIPGLQVYLFRRTSPDLMKNHMNGYMSFPEMLAPFIQTGQVKILGGEKEATIVWGNGSKIHMCHCQYEKDVSKYLGADIHVLLMDELTHFTDYIYRFLRSRVRLGGFNLPERWKYKVPLIVSATNPGSVGHAWVKRTFIDMSNPYEIRKMPKNEGGMLRQFIPALPKDNVIGIKNDPSYIDRLYGLGSPDLVKAMLEGNWDIVAGAAFENLSRDTHMIRPFDIPEYWTKWTSLDWGSSKPYAVGWFTVCEEQLIIKARDGYPEKLIGKGSIIMYRELYGWNGNPDEGCREESWEVAKKIAEIEDGEIISYRIADSAMWAQHDGASIAERFMDSLEQFGASCPSMEKSKKDRMGNYQEIRARLSLSDGENTGLYIFDTCHHFWRTVPDLQLDERHPEKGWDTRGEDHCFVAGTLIITEKGLKSIEDIATGEMVLTMNGFKPCISLGNTSKELTYKITLSDSYIFECTSSHPLLTPSGLYVRLSELQAGDKLCKLKLSQKKSSVGIIKIIGCVVNTFNVAVKGFTELYGSILTEIFPKAFTSTIRTEIERIIRLITLSYYQAKSILASICKSAWQTLLSLKKLESLLIKLGLKQVNGIKVMKEENGIVKLQLEEKSLSNTKKSVNTVKNNLWQKLKQVYFARIIVPQKTGALRIQSIIPTNKVKPVYNLNVPSDEHYCLANGLIVHNCADMLGYSLVSRPVIMDRVTYIEEEYQEARRKSFEADRGKKNTSRY